MLPISLTLQGVYSYQDTQTIDFRPLTQAGLFGIFGAVGSGKSSILEAISLVLYDKVERLDGKESTAYNMMNLRSNEMRIEFEFEEKGRLYRFTVHTRRNSKQYSNINRKDRAAYIFNTEVEQWEPIAPNYQAISGLSYDNFHRTVIIPQGKFQEFLLLKSGERMEMVTELFNFERFNLYDKASALLKQTKSELDQTEGHLKAYEQITAELLAETAQQLADAELQLNHLQTALGISEGHAATQERLKGLHEASKKAEAHYQELQAQAADWDSREADLQAYLYCVSAFKTSVEQVKKLHFDRVALQEKVAQEEKDLTADEVVLDKDRASFATLELVAKDKDNRRRKAEDYGLLADYKVAKAAEDSAQGVKLETETALAKIAQTMQDLKDKESTLGATLVSLKAKRADISLANAVDKWFLEKANLNKQLERATQVHQGHLKALAQLTPPLIPNTTDLADSAAKRVYLEQLERESTIQLETVQQQTAEYALKQQLSQYADELIDGAPCPLCGATHHPAAMDSHDYSEPLKALKLQQQSLNKTLDAIKQWRLALGQYDLNLAEAQGRCQESEVEQKAAAQALAAHLASFEWAAAGFSPDNEAAVKEALAAHKALEQTISTTEKEEATCRMALNAAQTNREQLNAQQGKALTEIALAQQKAQDALSRLFELKPEEAELFTVEGLRRESESLLKKLEAYLIEYAAAEQKLRDGEKAYHAAEARLKLNVENLTSLSAEFKLAQETLSAAVNAAGYPDVRSVQQILKKELDTNVEQSAISTFRQRLHTALSQRDVLLSQLEGQPFDGDAYATSLQALAQARAAVKEADKQLAVIKSTLQKYQQDWASKQVLLATHSRLTARSQDLSTLTSMFVGKGFVKYVSQTLLEQITENANIRFTHLTANQLRLQISADSEFEVLDRLNNNHTRHIKTLSGGQLFQASLSLALALAESVRPITSSEEGQFFFIDEGFGSQDSESLRAVFDTLRALRQEHRTVGIISHVNALQDEIENYLSVKKDQQKGSLISTNLS